MVKQNYMVTLNDLVMQIAAINISNNSLFEEVIINERKKALGSSGPHSGILFYMG